MAEGDKTYFDPAVLARISSLSLQARWVVEGIMSGIHRSRSKGFSVEFEQHREYSPGDEIRRIDWKALGKFDRYFIKEYEDETNLRAYLLIDTSGSMDYASDGITKFDYGCTLAASLAYLILRGVLKQEGYRKTARESAAFYSAWFLDTQAGGVYFNVLANGLPYSLGTERGKGSHSMAGYHSFELAYLAAVYTNLLITGQPMDFYFCPTAGVLPNDTLRVSPDLLPAGSVTIGPVMLAE